MDTRCKVLHIALIHGGGVEVYIRMLIEHTCIDSIINQTESDLEIILIDDGSTDDSGRICDAYAERDKRFRVLHKENGGVSSARNSGNRKIEISFFFRTEYSLLPTFFSVRSVP